MRCALPWRGGPRERAAFISLTSLPVVHANPHPAQRHEDLIVDRIRRDRVRIRSSWHVLDPAVGFGVDDSEHRAAWIVACRHVVVLIAGVVPDLVRSAYLGDGRNDVTAPRVHHLYRGRVAAAKQELLLRSEAEA